MEKTRDTSIIFEVNKHCNLECEYCYNHWKGDETVFDSKAKPKKILKKVMKKIQPKSVTLSGGEPTLYKDIEELVYISKLGGAKVNLITNGTQLEEERYKHLLQIGVSLVEVTINSDTAEIHEDMNKTKGSFAKSVNTIKWTIEAGVSVVAVIVVTKSNYKKVNDILRFMKSIGVRRIMLNRYNIGGENRHKLDEIIVPKDELIETFRSADELALELGMKIYAAVCSPICLFDPADYKIISFSHCAPINRRKQWTIDAYGDLRMCNHSPTVLGNINKESLDHIKKNAYLKTWDNLDIDYCNSCEYLSRCRGGCRAASEQVGQPVNTVDPIMPYYDNKAD